MHIKAFTYEYDNELCANTYIFYDDSKNCIIIDPSKEDEKVVKFIRSNGLALKAILLTHGHYDHIRGVDMLVEAFKAPVYIHKYEKKLLETPELNCSDRFSRKEVIIKSKTIDIEDGDRNLVTISCAAYSKLSPASILLTNFGEIATSAEFQLAEIRSSQ
jgi:glyoxylase-like metal-dependent hydrolase (beta-lactamase superfamily II)